MKIIYTNTDGTVSIITPSPEALLKMTIEQIALKDTPSGLSYELIEDSEIPTDRLFRNAWIQNSASIETDLPKAKEITHASRRVYREKLFKPLDIQATIPSQAQAAEASRAIIRQADDALQILIDDATTEAELRGVITDVGVLDL